MLHQLLYLTCSEAYIPSFHILYRQACFLFIYSLPKNIFFLNVASMVRNLSRRACRSHFAFILIIIIWSHLLSIFCNIHHTAVSESSAVANTSAKQVKHFKQPRRTDKIPDFNASPHTIKNTVKCDFFPFFLPPWSAMNVQDCRVLENKYALMTKSI